MPASIFITLRLVTRGMWAAPAGELHGRFPSCISVLFIFWCQTGNGVNSEKERKTVSGEINARNVLYYTVAALNKIAVSVEGYHNIFF